MRLSIQRLAVEQGKLRSFDVGQEIPLGTARDHRHLGTGFAERGGETALLIGAVLGAGALTAKRELVHAVLDLMDQGFSFKVLSGAASTPSPIPTC